MLQQARPYWGHVAAIFALNLSSTPLKLLMPVPLKIAVDSVLGEKPLPGVLQPLVPSFLDASSTWLLGFAAVLLVTVTFLAYLNSLVVSLLHRYTGERLVLSFRSRLFRHVQRLSLSYHDAKGTADSTYRIQYDAPAVQWIALDGIIPFISAVAMLAAMLYVTAAINWQLAAVALAVAPVLMLLTHTWGRRLRKQWRETKALQSSAMSVVQETLGALRVVKAFGTEEREHDRFQQHASKGMWGHLRVSVSQGLFELATGVVLAVGTATVLFLGVRHVQAGTLTLGDFLLVWAYLAQLYAPLQTISKNVTTLQGSLTSAERALALLDEAPGVVEKPTARPLGRSRGRVTFDNVGFAYRENQPVLQEVSFDVPAGSRVGIAGPTGAGKSTLLNLLTRFYDPTQGRILLDGVDLRDYRLDDLRSQFAIVLQDPLLFSVSIAENIGYARPGATQAEIIEAAKAANCHGFIEALPESYDTKVGERGMKLSGGERQRIALARAFLKDAPLLILDEPTSSIDTKTESLIMEALQLLMQGRTTFMIAHRLSTLEHCDVRVEIQDGQLAAALQPVSYQE